MGDSLSEPQGKRTGRYPTQKPILLLEQILRLVTDEGDFVIDPFAGSGTTVVAAKMLKRKYLGIDISAGSGGTHRTSFGIIDKNRICSFKKRKKGLSESLRFPDGYPETLSGRSGAAEQWN